MNCSKGIVFTGAPCISLSICTPYFFHPNKLTTVRTYRVGLQARALHWKADT